MYWRHARRRAVTLGPPAEPTAGARPRAAASASGELLAVLEATGACAPWLGAELSAPLSAKVSSSAWQRGKGTAMEPPLVTCALGFVQLCVRAP